VDKALVLDCDRPLVSVYEAVKLEPEDFLSLWPLIEVELDRVPHIWQDYWTKEFICKMVAEEVWHVWGFGPPDSIRVIVFTQISMYPAGAVFQAFLAFGNSLDDALPVMEATFERLCQVTGCRVAEVLGRPGWERKLCGFERTGVTLRKRVMRQGVH
jgi:hypothetical protein